MCTVLHCTALHCTVLYYCHRVSTQLQLTNISITISIFILLKNIQPGSGAQPVFYSTGTRVLSRGYSGWGGMLTFYIYPEPRLRISGVIYLLPLYAFMVWTRDSFSYFLNSYVPFCDIKQVGSRLSFRMYAGNSRFETRPGRCAVIHCFSPPLRPNSV
jgi:hypothetical protein